MMLLIRYTLFDIVNYGRVIMLEKSMEGFVCTLRHRLMGWIQKDRISSIFYFDKLIILSVSLFLLGAGSELCVALVRGVVAR